MRRFIFGGVVILALLIVAWVRWPRSPTPEVSAVGNGPEPRAEPVAVEPVAVEPPRRPARLPERSWAPAPLTLEAPVVDALDAVSDDGFVIQCDAADVPRRGPPRTYGTAGQDDPVVFSAFVGDRFVAKVREASGEASVQVDLADVGTVRWSGLEEGVPGMCTFDAPEWVEVRGQVEGPADGLFVRGCGHAAIVPVDEDGQFAFAAARGTTCWPFAFEETPTSFSRGQVLEYVVDGSPLVLEAPEESSREDLDLQRQRLTMAAKMFRDIEEGRPDPFAEPLASPELDLEVRAVLASFAAAEDAWAEQRQAHLEEMEAPNADTQLYRDLWLNLY